MTGALWALVAACGAFAASHFALSHPLRRPAVRLLGERGFLALYSLVALAAMVAMAVTYDRAPAGPALWDGYAWGPWLIASLLTLPAITLVTASLRGNPALPGVKVAGLSARKPWGVFRLTRHPMMMGFTLWAAGHVIVSPTARTMILSVTIATVALAGAALQDVKKLAQNHREWSIWMTRTRFWPDPRRIGAISGGAWVAGTALWIGVTALHWWIAGIPAGPWRLLEIPF